jgi:hypothetical protein
MSKSLLHQLDRRPAAEAWCSEHEYCRNWERPRSGSQGRRFAKTYFRRSVRRALARQLASDARV